MSKIELSIIVPLLNEEENIPFLIERITHTKGMPKSYELILVSDGSTDTSEKLIQKYARKNSKIKLIAFTRNFGQQVAIRAGLEHAQGAYVGIIDADLQDPPEKLIEMLQIAKKKNIDIVYATRKKRKESWLKKIAYSSFYKLYAYISESPVNIDSGDFSILHKKVVIEINNMPERIKFLRGLRSWTGFTSVPFPIDRPSRAAGQPKYTLKKLIKLAVEGITSTSTQPLKIATFLGAFFSLSSVILALGYIIWWLAGDLHQSVPGFATIVVLILFFGGLQLFTLGIIGEYIATIFLEVKNRPAYIIKKKVNIH